MGSRAILTPSTDHLITIASNPQAGDEPRRWWRSRVAFSSRLSNTRCRSPCELEMTRSISEVANLLLSLR